MVFQYVFRFVKLMFGLLLQFGSSGNINDGRKTGHYDFLLQFGPEIDPEQFVEANDQGNGTRNKHAIASQVMARLKANGVELRKVEPTVEHCRAYALRGRYQTLLKQAEKLKLRKVLKEGGKDGRTALFQLSRAKDFLHAEVEQKFFSSGERLMLMEELVTQDPVVREGLGFVDHRASLQHDINEEELDDNNNNNNGNNGETHVKPKRKRRASIKALFEASFGRKPVKVITHLVPLHDAFEVKQLVRTWIQNPFTQPLNQIKDYLGHSRAFYFAFLQTYTRALVPPAALGGLVFHLQQTDERGVRSPATLLYAMFLAVWTTSFLEYWKRKQARLAFEWDTFAYEEEEEEARPEFKERATPVYNEVADDYQWVYPGYRRVLAIMFSVLVCFGLSCLATVTMFYFLYLDGEAKREWVGEEWSGMWEYAIHIPIMAYFMCISVFSSINSVLSEWLTDMENHRTLTDHQNSLIVKLVTLQFCNYFVSLFYVAFYEQNISKLAINVSALLGFYQVIGQLIEVGSPLTQAIKGAATVAKNKKRAPNGLPLVGQTDVLLASQEDLFREYLELWIQFGQVTLFSMVFPLAALLALVNNIVETRTDAFKMLRIERRGIPRRASGIGSWLGIFETMGYIAVMTNMALIGIIFNETEMAQKVFAGWSNQSKLLLLVFLEHAIIGIKYFISIAVPDLPSDLVFLLQSRRRREEEDLKDEFELKTYCQDLLRKDLKQFAYHGSSDQAYQLLKGILHEEDKEGIKQSMLFQWLMDQNDRKRRAEKYARYFQNKLESVTHLHKDVKFSEVAQFFNIVLFVVAAIYLITKEARETSIKI